MQRQRQRKAEGLWVVRRLTQLMYGERQCLRVASILLVTFENGYLNEARVSGRYVRVDPELSLALPGTQGA